MTADIPIFNIGEVIGYAYALIYSEECEVIGHFYENGNHALFSAGSEQGIVSLGLYESTGVEYKSALDLSLGNVSHKRSVLVKLLDGNVCGYKGGDQIFVCLMGIAEECH